MNGSAISLLAIFSIAGVLPGVVHCGARADEGPRPLNAREHADLARGAEERAARASGAEAAQLRDEASAHRARARALVEEATSACAGVGESDRERGPLLDPSLVEGVSELVEAVPFGKTSWNHLRGIEIYLRAEPGLTRPWLGRLARCRIAMNATGESGVGSARAASDDPFAVGRPDVTVRESVTGFIVSVRAHGDDDAREIASRGRRLVNH